MKLLSAALLTIITAPTLAGTFSYNCKVHGEYIFGQNGELVSDQRAYYGQSFMVDRESGVVMGDATDNSSYPTKKIIDSGSEEQSYKLLWVSNKVIGTENGRNAAYLNIEEYNPSPSKPFSMILGARIVTGICK